MKNTKPFFYKVVAADFMTEVFQIPQGKHKEWLSQLAIDLVRAEGTTDYAKRLIEEANEYRNKQAVNGKKGGTAKKGKSKSKPNSSDALAPLSDALAPPKQITSDPQASNRSSTINNYLLSSKEESNGGDYYHDDGSGIHQAEDGSIVDEYGVILEGNPF